MQTIKELVLKIYESLEKSSPEKHGGLGAAARSVFANAEKMRAGLYPENSKLLEFHTVIAQSTGGKFSNEEIRLLLINLLAEFTAVMVPALSAAEEVSVPQQVEDSSAELVEDLNSAFLEICSTLGYV